MFFGKCETIYQINQKAERAYKLLPSECKKLEYDIAICGLVDLAAIIVMNQPVINHLVSLFNSFGELLRKVDYLSTFLDTKPDCFEDIAWSLRSMHTSLERAFKRNIFLQSNFYKENKQVLDDRRAKNTVMVDEICLDYPAPAPMQRI